MLSSKPEPDISGLLPEDLGWGLVSRTSTLKIAPRPPAEKSARALASGPSLNGYGFPPQAGKYNCYANILAIASVGQACTRKDRTHKYASKGLCFALRDRRCQHFL